jgi:hypothetical protein
MIETNSISDRFVDKGQVSFTDFFQMLDRYLIQLLLVEKSMTLKQFNVRLEETLIDRLRKRSEILGVSIAELLSSIIDQSLNDDFVPVTASDKLLMELTERFNQLEIGLGDRFNQLEERIKILESSASKVPSVMYSNPIATQEPRDNTQNDRIDWIKFVDSHPGLDKASLVTIAIGKFPGKTKKSISDGISKVFVRRGKPQ